MEWISVKDKMPPSNERVLICSDCGTVQIGYTTRKDEWRKVGVNPVTHWQPLPESPTKQINS
jgi:hypothetical protein